MTRILVDTSAYSAFMRGHKRIKLALQEAEHVRLCPIVLGELRAGFRAGKQGRENEQTLAKFLSSTRVDILPIDQETAVAYAQIIAFLRGQGTPIPANDVWIAACAMQHGLTLLTTDTHYEKVPQVMVEVFSAD